MGGIIALAFVALLIYGFISAHKAFRRMVSKAAKPFKDAYQEHDRPEPRPRGKGRVHVLLDALHNEGYLGKAKFRDSELRFVDDPILAEMLQELSNEVDLKWELPAYGLRYRRVPDYAPEGFDEKYRHVVLTNTHAIGF